MLDAIREGMTLAEVVAVVGAPPGDYRRSERNVILSPGGESGPARLVYASTFERWWGDEGCLTVAVGPDGRVWQAAFAPAWEALREG